MKRSDRIEGSQEGGSESEKERRRDAERLLQIAFANSLNPSFSHAPPLSFSPSPLAAACGIPITYETLPLAFGRVIYLAEASLQPPHITVNQTAIAKLAEASVQAPAAHRDWFTAAAIAEVAIAHELYHILAARPSSQTAECAAHEFAQALTGLPFSPRVYEAILQRTVPCRITTNII